MWICNDQKTWLSEGLLDLIGEGTRGETSSNGCGSGGMCKLEHSTGTMGS